MGCVISTCGTSGLTNIESRGKRGEFSVLKLANKTKEELTPEELSYLDGLLGLLREESMTWDAAAAKRGSAELNSLLAYYDNQVLKGAANQHYFISSDTYVGKECAQIAADWLTLQGDDFHAEVHTVPGLNTNDYFSFKEAMSELAKWCAEFIEPMRADPRYVVAFNLNGGFKSVQGFMQTLGMFYADETFYQFQGTDALLRIPRLPIDINTEVRIEIERHFDAYRKLSIGLPVTSAEVEGIHESMLFTDGKDYTLSAWGEIFWSRFKRMFYEESFKKPPYIDIRIKSSFLKDLKQFEQDKQALYSVNERLDDLARYLLTKVKYNPKRLYVHQIISKFKEAPDCTDEFYAWSHCGAWRVFCIIDKSSYIAELHRLVPHPKG
ncbi:hypothetical protein FACS1894167_04910 [Synergistales bacterium]|nr:hypothetical protein FACS1894167_04910 [Synergistales bacterium]